MKTRFLALLVALAVPVGSFAEPGRSGSGEPTAKVAGRVTAAASGLPLGWARVVVRGAGGVVRIARTDREGRYSFDVAPGRYQITFTFRSARLSRSFEARGGKVARVNGRLATQPGEEIIIHERGKARRAVARNYNPVATPPYSDRAITSNAWTKAWLLLDVDRHGVVRRVKFINRPGYDLETIALEGVFGLRFDPARNEDGAPIRSLVVWSIEWPAYWWLVEKQGVSTRMPAYTYSIESGPRRIDSAVPCKGSGPLALGSLHPVYRDCSRPDLRKEFDSEPWIQPDGRAPRVE
jgi:hypothetical protein